MRENDGFPALKPSFPKFGDFDLSVLKNAASLFRSAFAFGLRLRSKARCFKTRVFGRKLPNGKVAI